MPREASAEGRALIQRFEGLSLTAYLCPAGRWTIGFGHTEGVQPGDKITMAHADNLLKADLVAYGTAVDEALGACEASQHEFDAMVSLAFNVGVNGFKGSTVLRLHRQGNHQGAARAFGMWNKATVNGVLQEVAGLTRRRAAETALYLTPDAPGAKDMPQQVAAPAPVAASKTVIAGGAAVVAGVGSVADQVDQAATAASSAATASASLVHLVKQFGPLVLSAIALAAGAYMLWRYVQKKRRGEVIST